LLVLETVGLFEAVRGWERWSIWSISWPWDALLHCLVSAW